MHQEKQDRTKLGVKPAIGQGNKENCKTSPHRIAIEK